MTKSITIGRSTNCNIIMPPQYEKVSRMHARISIVGGHYVYEDMSKHGTVIAGRLVQNGTRVTIAPGADVLLAGSVPLPWTEVYRQLPLGGVPINPEPQPVFHAEDSLPVGYGILSFLIPLVGWILYFVWNDTRPNRAKQAGLLGCVGFVVNLIIILAAR